MTSRPLLFALLALLLLPLRASSQAAEPIEKSREAPALQKQIDTLLTAWVKKDFAGMQSVWSPRSEHWAPFKQTQERFFQNRDLVKVESLRFRGSVAEGKALLRIITTITWESPLTLEKQTDPVVWTTYWEKEGDAWKIHEFEDASVTLWMEFNRAKTAEEREAVWRKDPEAANAWVVRQFGAAAEALAHRGEWDFARRAASLQREAARLLGDGKHLGEAIAGEASISYLQADYRAAFKQWGEAADAYTAAKDAVGAARMRMNQAIALEGTGEYGRALALTEEAFQVLEKTGEPQAIATGRLNLGVLLFRLNRYSEALEQLQACVGLCQELKWEWGAAKALLTIASIWEVAGDYDLALEINQECLKVVRSFGQAREELATLNNLVIVARDRGDHHGSVTFGEEGLALARKHRDAAMEATIATNLAASYKEVGRYGEAIKLLDTALAAFERQEAIPGVIDTRVSLAVLHDVTEQHEAMLRNYEQALELARQTQHRRAEAAIQLGFANYYVLKGQSKKASDALFAAMKAADELGDAEAIVATRIAVIQMLNRAGNDALAVRHASELLPLTRKLRNSAREAMTLYALGRSEYAIGKHESALRHLEEAMKIAATSGDRKQEMHARWQLGLVLDRLNRPKEALAAYIKAADLLEGLRADTRERSLQTSFLAGWAGYYHTLIGAHLRAGSPEAAFAVAERVKGRGLAEMLQKGKAEIKKIPATERSEELKLAVRINSYASELEQAQALTTDQRLNLQKKLETARASYEDFKRRLFLRHQDLQVQRGEFTPASLADLGKKLFAKNPGACVLSYVSALEETLIFAVTAGPKPGGPARVTALRVPVKAEDLRDQAEQLRAMCSQPGGAYEPLAKKLFQLLIVPAGKQLAGKTQLIIVPDSAMPPMPFQALLDAQGKHVAERWSLSYAPSVTALLAMGDLKRRRAQEAKEAVPLFAVGRPQFTSDPDLPGTEAEVRRIAALAGPKSKVLTGKDASEARVRAEMGSARFVHLATHGRLNEAAPLYSGLALTRGPGDDGVLEARELMDLDLKAEMVVLSACESGLGKQVRGEGVLGLTWALFVAGAPTTVVTQWQVEDTSTGALMSGFYKALLQPGKGALPTKAEALRRAQLALMKDGKHTHPYYWAPFVVVGDWK